MRACNPHPFNKLQKQQKRGENFHKVSVQFHQNAIFINTLGRRLADREERIKIFGEVYYRRADVATIGGLSAHAGQDLLMEYALRVKDSAQRVFLVHGEEKPAQALTEHLSLHGMRQVTYPDLHESFTY